MQVVSIFIKQKNYIMMKQTNKFLNIAGNDEELLGLNLDKMTLTKTKPKPKNWKERNN